MGPAESIGSVDAVVSQRQREVSSGNHFKEIDPQEVLGIVACRVNATSHTREVVARLRSQFGAVVLEHSVREAIPIAEAPAFQLPITRYAPTSPVADDYRAVAAELLDRLGDLSSR